MQSDPIVMQGTRAELTLELRALLDDTLTPLEQDFLLQAVPFPEYAPPTPVEQERGVFKKSDGSGYLVLHASEVGTLQACYHAARALFATAKAAAGNLLALKDAGTHLWKLFGLLYSMRTRGVDVDAHQGLVLQGLQAGPAEGMSVAAIAEALPAHVGLTAEDVTEILASMQAIDRRNDEPTALVSRADDRWRAKDV